MNEKSISVWKDHEDILFDVSWTSSVRIYRYVCAEWIRIQKHVASVAGLCIGGVWCMLHTGKTVTLRRLRIKPGATCIPDVERTDFRVEGKHLIEIPAVGDGRDANGYGIPELLHEFKQQFQLSDA